MKKLALLGLFAASPAYAVGFGTTAGIGSGIALDNDAQFIGTEAFFLPSLDLRFDTFLLRIHLLETLGSLANETVFIGVDGHVTLADYEVAGNWHGVLAPGAGIDLISDEFGVGITAMLQMGIETEGDMGFGVYIVPAIGAGFGDSTWLITAGTLQFSVWLGS